MAVRLTGGSQPAEIDVRYKLFAPGFTGSVTLHDSRQGTTRSAHPQLFPTEFTDVLAEQELIELDTLQIDLTPSSPGASARMRGPRGDGAMALETTERPGYGQVALCVDESGVATWHYPEPGSAEGVTRFLLRAPDFAPADPDAQLHRGIIGISARLVKTFVYKVTDPVIGGAADGLATLWERSNRPSLLRSFEPGLHRELPDHELDADGVRQLGTGRALLFLHGTFSRASTGFGGLPDGALGRLHDTYGGRVFAFDHPTLSVDPADNVREFLARVPEDVHLDLDIVAHSRGGLVARTLVGEHLDLPIDADHVRVGRVVFAGTPNQGSALASPEHLPDLIDRYTTALNMLSFGPVAEVLDAIIAVVKVLAHGSVEGLEGLSSADPAGDFMSRLDPQRSSATDYFGMAANFESTDPGVAAFLKSKAMDSLFEDADNDLVVAVDSVESASMKGFHRYEPSDAVNHSGYFEVPRTEELLCDWLTG
jgi:hypothetical protein